MSETRKLAAILVADIVGYSRLAGADEDRILARLRTLRSDLIDPAIAAHNGRIVKRTGDGSIIEFRSVVDAVRCAIEVQNGLIERNTGLPPEKRIEFRVGIHLGDVVEESDGDLMGDGVNIAARLEGIAKPGTICLSEDAYRQVKQRLDLKVSDLGATQLKNIAQPIRVYSLEVGKPAAPRRAMPPLSKLFPALAALAAILASSQAGGPLRATLPRPRRRRRHRPHPPSDRLSLFCPLSTPPATPRTTRSRCASARRRPTISANMDGYALSDARAARRRPVPIRLRRRGSLPPTIP